MSVERINPSELAPPLGFSHAIIGRGTTVFLAGQTAMDGDGRIVGTTIVEQFERSLRNLLAALSAAGGSPDQLASVTIYVTDLDEYRANTPAIGEVWQRLVGPSYPAMAAVGVARLWDVDMRVELQGFAVI